MLRRNLLLFLIPWPWICFGHTPISEKDCDYFLESETPQTNVKRFYPNFTDNPCLSGHMKKHMDRWLLPLEHKMKPILDELFAHPSVINSDKSLLKAGFNILFAQKRSKIRVVSHSKLPGYLIKLYTNAEKRFLSSGWKRFTIRCLVAKKIKSIIARHKIQNFVVADKWLYPLPCHKTMKDTQPVILLVKNMDIYNREDAMHVWKNHVSYKVLRELYKILGRGYGSPFLSGNIPFSHKGKFAFIDTEYDKRNINLVHVKKFLPPKMRGYWDYLIQHHRL
jgi:hypothetical protein